MPYHRVKKAAPGRRRGPRYLRGRGSVGDWFNRAGRDISNWFAKAAVDTNKFLKESKLLSTVGKIAGGLIPLPGVGAAVSAASGIADQLGYGRRRSRRIGMTVRRAPMRRLR
jgi:hypothetical protein